MQKESSSSKDIYIYYTNTIGEQKVARINGYNIHIDDDNISGDMLDTIYYRTLHNLPDGDRDKKININGELIKYEQAETQTARQTETKSCPKIRNACKIL